MRLESAMQMIKEVVDTELTRFFVAKRKEARSVHPALVELVDQITDVTLRGGKRLRPFLCWVGYAAVTRDKRHVTRKTPRELLSAMLGLELFQTFAIIHDDIMDESTSRRGGPTVHEHFHVTCHARLPAGQVSPVTRAARFGESMGVLAGDLALSWADELMHNAKCQTRLPAPKRSDGGQVINAKWKTEAIDSFVLYQRMKEEVIYGQTLDVMRSIGVKDIEKGRVDELKTAYYSVVRPLQIGSSLALKDSLSERLSLLKTWERFGVPVGKLFQLRDDFLDDQVTGELFKKEARQLTGQAIASIEALDTSDEVKQLLADLVAFVQNRNS